MGLCFFRIAIGFGTGLMLATGLCPASTVFGSHFVVQEKSETTEDIFAKIGSALPLSLDENAHLKIELKDLQTSQAILRQLGANNGGSSGMSGNGWCATQTGPEFDAAIATNYFDRDRFFGQNQIGSGWISLRSKKTNVSELEIVQKNQVLRAFFYDSADKRFYWVFQGPQRFQLIAYDGENFQAFVNTSFQGLTAEQDVTDVREKFAKVGIGLPETAAWDTIDPLLTEFFGYESESWTTFLDEYSALDSRQFEERQAATDKLRKNISSQRGNIAYGMFHSETPVEIKARFREILTGDEDEPLDSVLFQFIDQRLPENPQVLIRWLNHHSQQLNDPIATNVIAQLQKLSGQTIGTDLKGWNDWLTSSTRAPVDASAKTPEIPSRFSNQNALMKNQETIYETARPELSRLLQLHANEKNQLAWDRTAWSEHFGNSDVKAALGDISKKYTELNLPKSWLRIGDGYDLETVGPPQLLFQRIVDACTDADPLNQMIQQSMGRGQKVDSNSLNRSSPDMSPIDLQILQQVPGDPPKEQFCEVRVADRIGWGRLLRIREDADGSLFLVAVSEDVSQVVLIRQLATGHCRLNIVSGQQTFHFVGDSFNQMLDQSGEHWASEVIRTFDSIGLKINRQ